MEKVPIPDDIAAVRRLQKQAYHHISSALASEENKNAGLQDWRKALRDYEKGKHDLQKGIFVKLEGNGEEYERAIKLQAKMRINLKDVESRLAEILKLIEESSSQPATLKKDEKNTLKDKVKESKMNTSKPKCPLPRTKSVGDDVKVVKSKTGPVRQAKQPTEEEAKKVSKLKNIDTSHAKLILDEVVENGKNVIFDDIGGMANAKQVLREIVILPALRPELFTGLRAPTRGLLLFGPPGNGKTLLAKAVASEANAVFFNITAATLTSKYIGEGEKLVRAMFAVARELQPSIIFIDEIDSLLCERKENEHEAVRRLKTEFLTAFDGVISDPDERILIMGATNRPWELDDAALRRLVKRIHVPLPDDNTRTEILKKLMKKQSNVSISESDYKAISSFTDGYSGSDLTQLAKDAALMPIREYKPEKLKYISADKIRGVSKHDFIAAMKTIRPSVSTKNLSQFNEWNSSFGCQ